MLSGMERLNSVIPHACMSVCTSTGLLTSLFLFKVCRFGMYVTWLVMMQDCTIALSCCPAGIPLLAAYSLVEQAWCSARSRLVYRPVHSQVAGALCAWLPVCPCCTAYAVQHRLYNTTCCFYAAQTHGSSSALNSILHMCVKTSTMAF